MFSWSAILNSSDVVCSIFLVWRIVSKATICSLWKLPNTETLERFSFSGKVNKTCQPSLQFSVFETNQNFKSAKSSEKGNYTRYQIPTKCAPYMHLWSIYISFRKLPVFFYYPLLWPFWVRYCLKLFCRSDHENMWSWKHVQRKPCS